LYFFTSEASTFVPVKQRFVSAGMPLAKKRLNRCQCLYLCTIKASKLSSKLADEQTSDFTVTSASSCENECQYLHFCTSKASKLSTKLRAGSPRRRLAKTKTTLLKRKSVCQCRSLNVQEGTGDCRCRAQYALK
jgi:hypothetical protein